MQAMGKAKSRQLDDLDAFIERQTTKNAEFPQMVESALETRRLVRQLVAERVKAGLTQDAVARRMGVAQPTVARFERGEIEPKATTVFRYALAIGRTLISRRRRGRGSAAAVGI
jgi:DNA-binding XRE family transcriptional regulator